MGFTDFYKAVSCLCPQPLAGDSRSAVLKNIFVKSLDALGHCEFDFKKRVVYCCPPSLVRLPCEAGISAALCGGRDPGFIEKLQRNASEKGLQVSAYENNRFYWEGQTMHKIPMPSAILVKGEDGSLPNFSNAFSQMGIGLQLQSEASQLLCALSASVAEVEQSLVFEDNPDIPGTEWEAFSTEDLTFRKVRLGTTMPDGVVCYTNRLTTKKDCFIRRGQALARVNRDWGKYIALKNASKPVLTYMEDSGLLAVPHYASLPKLFERAATLCSGFLPLTFLQGRGIDCGLPHSAPVDVYFNVPLSVAQPISIKLSQALIVKEAENVFSAGP